MAASDMADNRWRRHPRGRKYLGLTLDDRWNFEEHFSQSGKCDRPARPPSVQHRRWKKRVRCLYVNMVIFYGVPIWVLRTHGKPKFNHVGFSNGWSLERAYRTISYEARMRQC
ncbi:hypothetical protein QLX08_010323 [Tetragonisca angustula]|uniref:Uncharacterized protein n=1 Tax=Tetragonisca angustula TaxID=166442 RepID=A0AAW0ZCF3_9HYME